MTDRPHRPVPFADLTALLDAAVADGIRSRAEIASATAALVVAVGRQGGAERLIGLPDEIGFDTLAALWRDADPGSLAGALWALYTVRQWCHTCSPEVTRLWRSGAIFAPADAVVAGVAEDGTPDDIRRMADAVLRGAYEGDFAVALERAAAIFRVVAAGRRHASSVEPERRALELAARNETVATQLARAAHAWRAGRLH